MGSKKLICNVAAAASTVKILMTGYNCISIFLKGSKEHKDAGLADDRVLIRAWTYKARPDVTKRMKEAK